MSWLTISLALLIAAAAMVGLTNPVELRPQRVWKMAVTLPMLALGLLLLGYNATNPAAAIGQVTFYVFFFGVPGIIWTSNINWFAARLLSSILHGSGAGGGAWRPQFGMVKYHLKAGELDEALEALNEQLEKDPANYEGRLLLAQIHLDKKQTGEAIKALEVILNHPAATDEQKAVAQSEIQRIQFEFTKQAEADEAPPPIAKS